MHPMARVIAWAERGVFPDPAIRFGIRTLLRRQLAELPTNDCEEAQRRKWEMIARMDAAPIADLPDQANRQHYELPPELFVAILGPQRKYSCGYWPAGTKELASAEEASLQLAAERASIVDGMRILDLGCGWGAFSLWAARHFPASDVTAVSASRDQRGFIEAEAARAGLSNLTVITADMNAFQAPARYDRIVSVEMFEHMRNHRELMARIGAWLEPDGRFFMHIFCHRAHPYLFVDQGPTDWMGRYFFAGGMMPSSDLPIYFQDALRLRDQWSLNGQHYAQTLNAWLARMDQAREEVRPILSRVYGADQVEIWWWRWRLFFLACAELFAYRRGQEWWVGHYLFERR